MKTTSMAAEECSTRRLSVENSYYRHRQRPSKVAVDSELFQSAIGAAVRFDRPVRGDCPGGVAMNEHRNTICRNHPHDTRKVSSLGV